MTQVALTSPESRYSYSLSPLLQEGGGPPSKKDKFTDLTDVAAPTISDVFFSYLKEAAGVKNMIFKSISCLSGWVFTVMPTLKEADVLSSSAKDAKNWATLAEIPEKTANTLSAGADFYNQPGVGKFAALTNKIGLLTTSAIDVLRVASDKIKPMTDASRQIVTDIFNTALVFTTAYGTVEEMMKMASLAVPEENHLKDRVIAANNAQVTQSWLKIAMYTSYFALGVLGFAYVPVEPWVKLALATSGLGLSILGHFHKKLVAEPSAAALMS